MLGPLRLFDNVGGGVLGAVTGLALCWAVGAVLWVGGELLGVLLARMRAKSPGNAGAGVQGVGMMFRGVAVMVVLLAVVVSNTSVGVSAAIVNALAYTLEQMLSLVTYFRSPE